MDGTGVSTQRHALLVRGLPRVLSAAGGAAAFILALLWARAHVPAMVDAWLAKHPPHASPDLMWMPPPPQSELVLGKTQPRTFSITMGVAFGAVAAWFALDAALALRKATRWVAPVLGALLAAASLVAAARASHFLGAVALAVVLPLAVLFARYERGGEPAPYAESRGPAAIALVIEGTSFAWGIWLTCWTTLGALSAILVVAAAAAAAFRAATDLAKPPGAHALERDAIAGSPLLLLAFLGMQRDPSPWCVVTAVTACGVLAFLLRPTASLLASKLPLSRMTLALAAVAAPTALMAIVLMPMRFRDIGSIDHFDHESQHLGWLNSIHFGKLMMADAGYIYGPLREYLLYAYCAIGGLTLEHAREAHTWENFAGCALMLFVGWRVARGRPWLHLWWVYLLLMQTGLVFLVKYRDQLSFGWVDIARSGLACAALVGGMGVATREERDVPPWRSFFSAHRGLIAWGALCGLSILYSQDYGPCAAGAVGLAIVADSFARRNLGTLRVRLLRAVRLGLAWSAGVSAVLLVFVLVYAGFGKAGLMVHRLVTWTGFLLSASWSATHFCFEASSWLDPKAYGVRDDRGFAAIAYAMPALFILLGGAVVLLAIVRRTWSARVALLCALFLFAYTTYRHALIRADIYHARSDGTGAVLLFYALMCDVAQLRLFVGRRARAVPLGAVIVALVAFAWPTIEESWEPLREKVKNLASGDDSPSHGEKYDNKDVPRAGDVNVPANVRALVKYVAQVTKPTDPVWVTTGFMTGGALQFAINRRNPTAFDVAHELTTRGNQAELVHALKFDPPILIVGDYFNLIGEEAHAYIAQHWKRETVPGYGSAVWRYLPPSPADASH